MVTSDGPQPITPEFQDDAAGTLTFVEYRAEPDFRLHVEPGGDSFRVLQEAGAKATTQYRDSRQRARQEMLAQLNQPNEKRIQDGRRINREFADMKRPRGKGAAFVVKSGE